MTLTKNETAGSKQQSKTIIYFGNEWGADNRTSSHHIAKRLMRDYNVIYVECPGLRAPQLNKRDLAKVFKKIFQLVRKKRVISDTSFVKTLYQIPFHAIPLMKFVNSKLIVWQIKKIYRENKLIDPVLWCVVPHVSYIIEKLKYSCSVYYCVDDYSELPGVNKKLITELDEKISKLCDLLFVTSDPLLEQKKLYGDKVRLSKHGVDYDHFYSALSKSLVCPPELQHIESPVIGFFGLIEEWVDLELIEYIAEQKPDWNILLIGRVAVNVSSCKAHKNIHFIGSVEYEKLPAYSQKFDVALIPVKTNELIRNFNPLKLREYLAMGLPVVSVYFPEIDVFGKAIHVANDKEEFVNEIQLALKETSYEEAVARAKLVESSSWESRYTVVKNLLESKLSGG